MIHVKPEKKPKAAKAIKAAPVPAVIAEKVASVSGLPIKYFPLTISVDEGLLARLDREWHGKRFRSRSEAARQVLEKGLPK